MAIVYEKQSVSKTASNTIALVEKITTKTFKDDNRDNYGQKVWEAKIARTNKFEAYYASNLKNIWAEQEKDMTLSLHKGAKSYKESWNSTKYVAMWMSLFL